MLKQVIKREQKEQKVEGAVLFDGICETEEYYLWMEEDEPTIWMMQVYAMVQRLGRSVDKFDTILSEDEYLFAWRRELIWQKIRQGEMESAKIEIAEYERELEKITQYNKKLEVYDTEEGTTTVEDDSKKKENGIVKASNTRKKYIPRNKGETMPKGEQALHMQFLALAWAEIARRQKRPYTEQLEIILNGLLQTISKTAWGMYQGKILPQRGWLKTRRLHLMEQFMLERFARIWECMGKEEEAFLWYKELAEYLLTNVKDRADLGKLYPLLCYRMAENRLHTIFQQDICGESIFCLKTESVIFSEKNKNELQKFQDAQEGIQILEKLTNTLKMLCLTQKQYPLFRNMEHMRLMLLKKIPLFGEHTTEENIWNLLEGSWKDIWKMVSHQGIKKETSKAVAEIEDNVVVTNKKIGESDEDATICDNFDPDYMERSLHSFKELLYRRMELHDLDIYELGDGIYADPKKSLIPVFKGSAKPKPKKQKMLQDRLGMYWKNYDPGFLTENDTEYKKYARMMRAYYSGKYKEGKKLLEELEEKMDWKYETNEQFATYWDALFDWQEGKINESEKNAEMWKVIEYSGIKKEKLAEVGGSLMKTEWRALMEISWNYEGENLNFLAKVLKKQKEYLEEEGKMGFFREYYIKILYCLCHIERNQGNLDEAEQYADQGLKMMYQLDLYTQWGALLFEKFRIVENRKKGQEMRDKDFDYIRQAYAVEKMFLQNEIGCKMIEDYLNEHYGQDMLANIKGEN